MAAAVRQATTRATVVLLLIVEDSASDLALTKHALDEAGVPLSVLAARDGEQAMQLLRSVHRPPDLILLHLNLSGEQRFLGAAAC